MNDAPGTDPGSGSLVTLQPPRRQRAQRGSFLGEPLVAAGIASREHLAEPPIIGRTVGEIAAAAQVQRLVHRLFEPVVALLRVAVLMRLTRIDLLHRQAVMIHQRLITLGKLLYPFIGRDS